MNESARTTYAAFPPALKTAMKIAAKRFDWCPKTWVQQTEAIAEAMLTGGWTADELADAYRNPPPDREIDYAPKPQSVVQSTHQPHNRL